MNWLFKPAVSLLLGLTNTVRFPLIGILFLVPLAITLRHTYAELSEAEIGLIFATVALAVYFLAALNLSSKLGWGVINRVAHRVRENDLREDELKQEDKNMARGQYGETLNTLRLAQESLREIVGQVRTSSGVIVLAAREIAAGNTNLSRRTEDQASTLEQTASGMEQLASTVKQNADNCKLAKELAQEATVIAAEGAQSVHSIVETMKLIDHSSKTMGDIIGVIEGIAFQTNILALNAAVEAARAGEQGRGFAVVAEEVRNLAQKSSQAAKEIKVLIDNSMSHVNAGSNLVDAAGKAIDEIVVSVRKVSELIGGVAAASAQQSAGVEEMNRAMTQLDSVTQQNAALVEEAAAAAVTFEEEAMRLAEAVSIFKLDARAAPAVRALPATHISKTQFRPHAPIQEKNNARSPRSGDYASWENETHPFV
jgi:methyl-accepting chemotaxis protein